METALTNLTTAWQGLVQTFTDSDFIIGIVNTAQTFLTTLTNILE